MQGEFACHAGLRARFFCRCCWVKGKGGEDMDDDEDGDNSDDDVHFRKGKEKGETLVQMVRRVINFMKVCVVISITEF